MVKYMDFFVFQKAIFLYIFAYLAENAYLCMQNTMISWEMKKYYMLMMAALMLSGCRQQPGTPIDSFVETHKNVAVETNENVEKITNILIQRMPKGVPDKLIQRKAYTTSYNHESRTPNWVAWTLTREHTRGSLSRENERFEEDREVKTPRATFQDYYSSRFDRGHMCPAGDNKWDEEAMTQTFLMTNICPQNHGLNKEDWNELEKQCRPWARRYGAVTIVCGPIFNSDAQPRFIGRNKVRVPDRFFKVVYCAEPEPRTLAFIFHNSGKSQPWRQQLCTVDEVEALTGINFFPALPDNIENQIEAESILRDWQ